MAEEERKKNKQKTPQMMMMMMMVMVMMMKLQITPNISIHKQILMISWLDEVIPGYSREEASLQVANQHQML